MILYGETGRTRNKSTASKVSYQRYYEKNDERRRDYSAPAARNGFDYDELVFQPGATPKRFWTR